MANLDSVLLKRLRIAQRNEITECHIYSKLAKAIKNRENSRVLQRIAKDELEHHNLWARYTQTEAKSNRWAIFKFFWISRVLGITFGIKLMEKGEERLNYVGAIVLGLNDALVELTGALAGFTFALQNTRLIALAGLITGTAASYLHGCLGIPLHQIDRRG